MVVRNSFLSGILEGRQNGKREGLSAFRQASCPRLQAPGFLRNRVPGLIERPA
jgi:hypothetical protein